MKSRFFFSSTLHLSHLTTNLKHFQEKKIYFFFYIRKNVYFCQQYKS